MGPKGKKSFSNSVARKNLMSSVSKRRQALQAREGRLGKAKDAFKKDNLKLKDAFKKDTLKLKKDAFKKDTFKKDALKKDSLQEGRVKKRVQERRVQERTPSNPARWTWSRCPSTSRLPASWA